jgi:proliferating cell nuclear antigen PCNA
MKIVFESVRKIQQFAAVFANLKNFTDNVSIYFRPTGIYIQCMDNGHCCLFECDLKSSWFEEYDYDESTDQSCIGINIAMMNKVLTTWDETQTFTIELSKNSDKISINFEKSNDKVTQFDKYFELPLVILDNELMNVQLFETCVDLTVDSNVFCSLIKNLTIFNDVLTLTFNEENIECVSSGADGSMKALISADDVKEYAIPESTTLTQSYSLRYVQYMCQFNKLSTEMKLGFGETMPMTMKYSLSDDSDDNESQNESSDNEEHENFARIHLAPKIIDEE